MGWSCNRPAPRRQWAYGCCAKLRHLPHPHVDCVFLVERPLSGLVTRSADAALTTGVRSLRVAFDAAAAAKTLFSGELEALSAFGTKRYTAQAMQVTPTIHTYNSRPYHDSSGQFSAS